MELILICKICKLRKKESYFDKCNQKSMLHEQIISMKSFSKFDLDCFAKENLGTFEFGCQ